jgi:hypothetical protein
MEQENVLILGPTNESSWRKELFGPGTAANGYAPGAAPNLTSHDLYTQVSLELLNEAARIEREKRPGYVVGDADVLKNFKAVAQRLGLTPAQVWGVYFLKHVDAITAIMTRPELPVSEPPIGRFADALNYLKLGYALHREGSS